MTKLINQLLTDRRGATAVEYGLILSLVVIAAMGALITLSNKTNSMWNTISASVTAAMK